MRKRENDPTGRAAPRTRLRRLWDGQSTGGFAFVMALLLALLVAGIATTIAVVSATESTISRNYASSKKTLYLAEAGIQHGLWQLSKDPTNRSPLVAKDLLGDRYDAVIAVAGYGLYDIAARGRSPTAAGTGILVRASVFPQAFNYALATTVYNDKSLSAQVRGAVGGALVTAVQIDWAALAASADWVIPSNAVFSSNFYYNGTVYVRGDVQFTKDVWVEGTLVAEGKIRFEGGSRLHHVTSPPGMPALVAGSDILLGSADAWGEIEIWGAVVTPTQILLERWNDLFVDGCLVATNKIEFHRDCTDIVVQWSPNLRLRPPFGILQASGAYAWALVPGTWTVLTDMTPFVGL